MTTVTQARVLFRWLARGGLRVLAITLLIATVVAAALAAVALWQDWPEVAHAPTDADGTVVIGFTTTIFGIPLAAVAIAAFVVSIATVGSFTRPLLATGATRSALALAHLAHVLLLALAASALAAAVLALEAAFAGGWIGSTFGLAPGDTFADGVPALVQGFLGALAGLVAGSLVAALSLRWPWWVGVGALAVTLWVLPVVVASVPPLEAAASAVAAWPWSPGAGAVLLAAAHWLVMRRMPVP